MTNKKNTKRALLMSGLSLLICMTMLIGSTFAWFTDSVTSSGNIIKSGTLDVTMEWKDATATGAQQTYKDASEGAIFNYDKWEPGYVEAKNIKIGNAGTLALKYQLNIVATGEVSELADVIDVYYAEGEYTLADRAMSDLKYIGTLTEVLAAISTTASGDLLAGESDIVTLALKMQESAGNEYQGLSIGSEFAVQLLATQLTAETDSFNNQYDQLADYDGEISNSVSLAAAMENGGTYKVVKDVDVTDEVISAADGTVIDLGGNTLSANYITSSGNASFANGTLALSADGYLWAEDGAKITLEDVVIDSDDLSVFAYTGGTVVLKDVTIKNATTSNPVQNYGGTLVLENVTVVQEGDANSAWYSSAIQVINEIAKDSETNKWKVISQANTIIESGNYTGKKAVQISAPGGNVTINGGTFVGSDYVIQDDFSPNNYIDGNSYESVITINGGSFTGNIKVTSVTKLVIKGGTFSADPTDYVADGYGVIDNGDGTYTVVEGTVVSTVAELQSALDAAADGDVITLGADITGNVKVTQKADVKITINGNGNEFTGVMTVFGNGRKTTAGLTIKNIDFVAANGASSCIVSPDRAVNNAYSYSTNVTVENCTFTDPDGTVDCAAVRHQDGGDSNWKIIDCVVDKTMHSLIQTSNVQLDGLTIEGCEVYSKNGINLNYCTKVSIIDCTIDVKGYAVRYGVNGSTVNGTFEIKDSTLKSANDDSDAVIIFRGTMTGSTLTITNTTLVGDPEITGNANVVKN